MLRRMEMFNNLGALEIFNTLSNFMKEIARVVSWEYLLYGGVALTVFVILLTYIRIRNTYEMKLLKSINKMNKYFAKNPYINDDNIVEVNERFKRVPHSFRYAWQQFMLNRDKLPSDYINSVTCLDQPLKASAHSNSATVCQMFTIIIAGFALFIGLAINYTFPVGDVFEGLFKISVTPAIILLLGSLFVAFLRARFTAITTDVYREFHVFESHINKACTTMPQYIDYEVLFTKKEIKDGIPALQEYLEKRALQEQKEKEEASLNKNPLEKFNFDDLGVENALLLERAMSESEKYFNLKRNLTEQITSKEAEMYNFQKNFDEVTKDFERKAQAVRESLKQLNEQLNSTTVNIEANYIKKRYKEDQQKLQQLEKDYEIATIRFNKQQSDMQAEIDSFKKEIERRKADVEKSMMAEGKSYANKIYGQINSAVTEQNKPIMEEQQNKINEFEQKIADIQKQLEDKQVELNNTQTMLQTTTQELHTKQSEIEGIKNLKEYLTSPEFKERVVDGKKGTVQSNYNDNEAQELRRKAQMAEEQLRLANERQKALEDQEKQLLNKLKQLEQNEKKLTTANAELTKSRDAMQKKTSELDNLNKRIAEENKNLISSQADLQNTIAKTIENIDKKPAPRRKTTLSDLVESATKIEKKNKK